MSIVLFAIIGAKLKLGIAYWICFGAYCVFRAFNAMSESSR